jgi:hypothetical protein
VTNVVEHVLIENLGAESLEGQRFPVLGEDPVADRVQSVGCGGHYGLVAVDWSQRPDLSLTLEVPQTTGLSSGLDHVHEDGPELFI